MSDDLPGAGLLVRGEAAPGIALLTLHRTEKLNALSYALVDRLAAELDALEAADGVRAVVLTGAGRAFSAGADIPEFAASIARGDAVAAFCRRGQRLTARIESFPKPIVTAVNGLAFGGGCEIVEASHLTVASRLATFGKPEIALGMLPTFGGTQRLPRIAGRKRALRMILTGEPISASAALAIGLVNEVVEPGELLPAAIRLAQSVLRHADVAIAACLAAVTRGLNASIDEGLAIEAAQFAIVAPTAAVRAGTASFVERRAARAREA